MNFCPWNLQKRIPPKRKKIFKIFTMIKTFKSFKNSQSSMTVTEKKRRKLSMRGGKTHVKMNCESLMLKVMPILTLLYTAHRHNLQQKYWRASWSKNLRFGS